MGQISRLSGPGIYIPKHPNDGGASGLNPANVKICMPTVQRMETDWMLYTPGAWVAVPVD